MELRRVSLCVFGLGRELLGVKGKARTGSEERSRTKGARLKVVIPGC